MFPKIFKQILLHKLMTGISLLLIIIGGYFGYQKLAKNKNVVQYATAAVEKGTLIVSVSGSGQVIVLDQVDIKPKVSADVAWIGIKTGQEAAQGQAILSLDDADIQKEIANAEWDFNQEKKNYDEITINAERSLATAYEDGYSNVSTIFFKLSDYMKDLKDVLGTEQSAEEYISAYKLILGSDSIFIQKLLDDYDLALNLFNKNFAFFREVYKKSSRDTIYQLIDNTLETTKSISQALESARHIYDAITVASYQHFSIASQVDKMQPKIESDVSSVYSNISSLQKIKDTIDDTNKSTPEDIAVAQKNLLEKEDTLKELKKNLSNYIVRTPFAGIIAKVNVEKGDSVSAGTTLATLITKQRIAEISLNEVDVAKVKVGQKVTLTFDALPEVSISGQVSEVDAVGTVSQGVVSYGVKIAFDTQDERIKPGMSVTADIITDAKQDVLVLPNSAIKSQGNSYYVELVEVDNNEFRQQLLANVSGTILPKPPQIQAVEIGLSNDLSTEIISGLKEGDIVVTSTISSNKVQTTQTQTNQSRGTQEFRIPGMSR
jgi:HlyD family secretion protein